MLPMMSKELGKACFNTTMSQTTEVEQEAVTLVDCTLRADLTGNVALGDGVQGLAGVLAVMKWPRKGLGKPLCDIQL